MNAPFPGNARSRRRARRGAAPGAGRRSVAASRCWRRETWRRSWASTGWSAALGELARHVIARRGRSRSSTSPSASAADRHGGAGGRPARVPRGGPRTRDARRAPREHRVEPPVRRGNARHRDDRADEALADLPLEASAGAAGTRMTMTVASAVRAAIDWLGADESPRVTVDVHDSALTITVSATHEGGVGPAGAVLAAVEGSLGREATAAGPSASPPRRSARPTCCMRQGRFGVALPWHAVARLRMFAAHELERLDEPRLAPLVVALAGRRGAARGPRRARAGARLVRRRSHRLAHRRARRGAGRSRARSRAARASSRSRAASATGCSSRRGCCAASRRPTCRRPRHARA